MVLKRGSLTVSKLSTDNYLKAKTYIQKAARPLDQALFNYYFEHGSAQSVTTCLRAFQNIDGGFGHGLEPDVRLRDSSVLATTIALQYLGTIEASSDHELVQGAIEYLLKNYNRNQKRWPIVPPQVNDHPHAPWWHYDPTTFAKGWGYFRFNPRAEIIGYLWAYNELIEDINLDNLTTLLIKDINKFAHEVDPHEIFCCLRMMDSSNFPEEYKKTCSKFMIDASLRVVEKDPAKWGAYCVKPLWLAHHPKTLMADVLSPLIETNLDYEIDAQGDDGAWAPHWDWGQNYPKQWSQACLDWKGHLTVKALRCLQQYGRLELRNSVPV